MVAAEEDFYQSLQILLSTQPGERAMSSLFGCDLRQSLFEEIDQSLLGELRRVVTEAIVRFEGRIDLDEVEIEPSDDETGRLSIHVRYTVRGTNSRYNMVYAFYLEEATQVRAGAAG